MSTQSHPQASEKEKFHEIRIYMIFHELVNEQKQFVEFAVHSAVKGEVIFYILMQN